MRVRFALAAAVVAAAFAAASPAFSQPLQVQVVVNGFSTTIGNNGSVSLTAPGTGQAVFANVNVQNTGSSAVTINSVTVTGSTDITLTQLPAFPLTLNGNSSATFTVQYSSATGLAANSQVIINYTASGTTSTFNFTVTGTAPRLTYSYVILPNGNSQAVNSGGVIAFPSINVGSSATAVISVVNTGTASVILQSATVTGSGFALNNSPAPVQVAPGGSATINVLFAPQAAGAAQGILAVGIANNSSVSFTLTGTGTSPNFSVTYTLSDGNAHNLVSGASIVFPSVDINGSTTATIAIANQGTGAGTVTNVAVSGTGFRLTGLPAVPFNVAAGTTQPFGVVFNPPQAGTFTGALSITLGGTTITATLTGSTSSSNFSIAYTDPTTNNTLGLQDGATLTFPSTLVNSSSTITVKVTNNGSGTGVINSITLGGASASSFQVLNQPALPASVPPNQSATFAVKYSPQQQQAVAATLTLNLNGQTMTINLAAQATGPQYTYTWTNSSGAATVTPGGTIALGNTTVGQTTSVTVTILNAGTGDGQIANVSVTGQGLTLTNLPAVPFTLHPNGTQTFTLNFAPTQPSTVNGTLTIGGDTFKITATGIGSLLTYSYTNSASTVPVSDTGTVIFPPTAVQSQSGVTFTVQNTGTSSATISSINLAAPSSIYILQQLPALPTNLNPGGSLTFTVNFVPNNVGTLTATLHVNSATFTLSGTGTQPAALPTYQFQGPSGTQQPAQQPAVGLSLASPYSLPLQGTLTLTFASAVFTDDPSIQFATGGRTVSFTIPANTTQAVFTGGATTMPLQTGTTAGTIVVTPSFATQNGFDLTPSPATTLTLNIQKSAPQLSSASITSETLSGFSVILHGFTTTRSLTQLDIEITPQSGQTFSPSHLTVNVSSTASGWFQSNASQPFGGTFLVAIPFILSNGTTTTDLVHKLQSLSITATNDSGTSAAITVPIP